MCLMSVKEWGMARRSSSSVARNRSPFPWSSRAPRPGPTAARSDDNREPCDDHPCCLLWRAASAGALLLLLALPAAAQTRARPDAPAPGAALGARFDAATTAITGKVVTWRRDLHQHPELGNREFRTSKIVADHLTALGLEVKTGIAHTGVVGILRGGKPEGRGPRADMDALPVAEQVNLPFASKATAQWNGREVGVMHACGHDNHVSILMGVAEALALMKADLPGTVMFIFQPRRRGRASRRRRRRGAHAEGRHLRLAETRCGVRPARLPGPRRTGVGQARRTDGER